MEILLLSEVGSDILLNPTYLDFSANCMILHLMNCSSGYLALFRHWQYGSFCGFQSSSDILSLFFIKCMLLIIPSFQNFPLFLA